MNQAAASLAVWHVRPGWHSWEHWREAEAWAFSHGLADPGPDGGRTGTYRIEFHLVDTPFAKVFRFALNAAGCHYKDPDTGDAALAEPETMILGELPPEHLRHAPQD